MQRHASVHGGVIDSSPGKTPACTRWSRNSTEFNVDRMHNAEHLQMKILKLREPCTLNSPPSKRV